MPIKTCLKLCAKRKGKNNKLRVGQQKTTAVGNVQQVRATIGLHIHGEWGKHSAWAPVRKQRAAGLKVAFGGISNGKNSQGQCVFQIQILSVDSNCLPSGGSWSLLQADWVFPMPFLASFPRRCARYSIGKAIDSIKKFHKRRKAGCAHYFVGKYFTASCWNMKVTTRVDDSKLRGARANLSWAPVRFSMADIGIAGHFSTRPIVACRVSAVFENAKLPTSSLPTESGSGNCLGNSLPTLVRK